MGLGGGSGAPNNGGAGAKPEGRSAPVGVTPQCAGGLALELMLGTVGTGASECVRCGAVGAAGVGVGAANGADRAGPRVGARGPPSVGARGAPNAPTSGVGSGPDSDTGRGPGNGAAKGVASGAASGATSGATSDGASDGRELAADAGVLRDKLPILLKLSRSLFGLCPRGEYEIAAPAAPVEPGV